MLCVIKTITLTTAQCSQLLYVEKSEAWLKYGAGAKGERWMIFLSLSRNPVYFCMISCTILLNSTTVTLPGRHWRKPRAALRWFMISKQQEVWELRLILLLATSSFGSYTALLLFFTTSRDFSINSIKRFTGKVVVPAASLQGQRKVAGWSPGSEEWALWTRASARVRREPVLNTSEDPVCSAWNKIIQYI